MPFDASSLSIGNFNVIGQMKSNIELEKENRDISGNRKSHRNKEMKVFSNRGRDRKYSQLGSRKRSPRHTEMTSLDIPLNKLGLGKMHSVSKR